MSRYRQGDVVLIAFPFTDLTDKKPRPVVIISSDWYNDRRKDIIVSAVTSQIPTNIRRDEFLINTKRDLHASRLPKPFVVKLGKIMTLEKRDVIKSFGRLPEDTTRKIIKKYFDVLGHPEYAYVEKKDVEEYLSEQESKLRRIFGFEKEEKKKPDYYFKSPEFDETKVIQELSKLKTDMDWVKRLLWLIIGSLIWLVKANLGS
ncbi:MAG: type II toxin-antitoxin system PemK/MazF family toxin [Candidatus Hydrothermarchaeales archaeon]